MPDGSAAPRGTTIRTARVEDAAAMGELMVTTWLAAHRHHIPAAAWQRRREQWTPADSAAGWARVLRERDDADPPTVTSYLVAEDLDGRLVALLAAAAPTETVAEVGSLYVEPQHQREGLGRRLLRWAAADLAAQGVERLEIGVVATNVEAQQFYAALGGVVIGERTFDEDGDLLAELVYGWSDLRALSAPR